MLHCSVHLKIICYSLIFIPHSSTLFLSNSHCISEKTKLLILWTAYQNPHRDRSHSLDSCRKGSSRSSLQAQGEAMWWNNDSLQGPPSPTMGWDWSGLQITISNPKGSGAASVPPASPGLLQPHDAALAQEPCDRNPRKAQGPQFGQASYNFIPSFSSVSRMLQK